MSAGQIESNSHVTTPSGTNTSTPTTVAATPRSPSTPTPPVEPVKKPPSTVAPPQQQDASDYGAALKALRTISHSVACKAVNEVPHNLWVVAGLQKAGITAKKVNDRIHHVKLMVSALNRAETTRLEFECRTAGTGHFAMANGATFNHVKGHRRSGLKKGWNQGASRAGGRDKKMMMADAYYGDMDLDCDRLFTDGNGDVKTVS